MYGFIYIYIQNTHPYIYTCDIEKEREYKVFCTLVVKMYFILFTLQLSYTK